MVVAVVKKDRINLALILHIIQEFKDIWFPFAGEPACFSACETESLILLK